MQNATQQSHDGPHRAALRACVRHFPRMLGLLILNLLVRGIALLPLILTLTGHNVFRFPASHAAPLSLAACAPLAALLVLPLRFYTRATLMWAAGFRGQSPSVSPRSTARRFGAAMLRLLRALPFLAPIAAFVVLFYIKWATAGFNEFGLFINDVGALVGGDYPHGAVILAVGFVVLTALAIWGWRRDLAYEFLAVDTEGIHASLRRARDIRRLRFNGLGRITVLNILIVLPAIAAAVYLIEQHLIHLMVGDLKWDLTTLLVTLTTLDFPVEVYRRIGVALLVLYVPFVLWRKTALACGIGRIGAAR